MKFIKTPLVDLKIINYKKYSDLRGDFFRNYCYKVFKEKNTKFNIKQSNISINKNRFTLRRFHFQKKPIQETKIITPIQGSIYNVAIDLRKKSKTFLKHYGFYLNSKKK